MTHVHVPHETITEQIKKMMAIGDPPVAIAKKLGITEDDVHKHIAIAMQQTNAFLTRINGSLTPENFIHNSLDNAVKKLAETGDVEGFFSDAAPAVALQTVNDALTGDPKIRSTQGQQVLDRAFGKPKQVINITARYDTMNTAELQAKARGRIPMLNLVETTCEDVTPPDNDPPDEAA